MALISRVHTLRGDGNMKFGIPPKRVMRCHTTRKIVREINPRMSLLVMVFLNRKAREERKEFSSTLRPRRPQDASQRTAAGAYGMTMGPGKTKRLAEIQVAGRGIRCRSSVKR